jgi:hypothetical protein
VAAPGAAGYALASPLVARPADRAGQRTVLRPLMVVFAAATAALITGAQASASAWVLLAASGLAGAATPQLGSMVRARWSALLAGSPLLHAAFSLESVADEVIFVAGRPRPEITRTGTRVRTAMAARTRQGRYLGGRPPYGYRLAEAGPHPNKAHAAWRRRAHRLEPDLMGLKLPRRPAGPNLASSGADESQLERDGHGRKSGER